MKKVILDENLPQPLRHLLAPHEAFTVHYMGWSGIQNGELIKFIDSDFDVIDSIHSGAYHVFNV